MSGTVNKKKKSVDNKERKRAIYSCDRCKSKKTKCNRLMLNEVKFDNETPCTQCMKLGLICKTQIPRKKRSYSYMSESSKYQLEYMSSILKRLYPQIDVHNMDDLKSIMCSTQTGREELEKIRLRMDADRISRAPKNNYHWNVEDLSKKKRSSISVEDFDKKKEEAQYYGLEGTSGFLNALLKFSDTDSNTGNRLSTSTVSTNHNFINSISLTHMNILEKCELFGLKNYPFVEISESEAEGYVNYFFEKIHPAYFIFEEEKFRQNHAALFQDRERDVLGISDASNLTNEDICSIYIVWILGQNAMGFPVRNGNQFDLTTCFQVVQLLLGQIVTNSSLNSVRVLYVTALYYESIQMRECSWSLFGLAAQQCISLGYHRKSEVDKYTEEIQDEIKYVWWSIYKIQLSINSTLGRIPIISIESSDLSNPGFLKMKDSFYKNYFSSSIELFKIMGIILDHRKRLLIENNPLSKENLKRVNQIESELNRWFENLSDDLKELNSSRPLKRYHIKLHYQYHYVYISLVLPYLLYLSKKLKRVELKSMSSITSLLCYGIKSAELICDVVETSHRSGQLVGLLNYDLFYAYIAIMVLILSFTLINNRMTSKYYSASNCLYLKNILAEKFSINSNSLLQSINKIKQVNLENENKVTGLMRDSSRNITLLLSRFGLLEILNDYEMQNYANSPSIKENGSYSNLKVKLAKDNDTDDMDLFNFTFNGSIFRSSNFDNYFVDLGIFE